MTGIAHAGIPLAVFATTAYYTGLVLEKRALEHLPPIDVRRIFFLARTLLTAPPWLAGFALTLCGLAFQAVVLTLEPVTVVQPILACGIVVVLLLSRIILREHLGGGELGCVAVMAASVILLALSDGGPATGVCYGIGTGLLYGVAALAIKDLSGVLVHSHSIAAVPLAMASSPYLYVMAGCIAAGFGFLQTALQRCRASIVVPVSTIAGSLYFMVAGTWLFHEHLPSDPGKLALRLTGILVAGVVLVMLPRLSGAAQLQPPSRYTTTSGPVSTTVAPASLRVSPLGGRNDPPP